MREILFRGKRVDNGEWVYGYYVKGATRHCIKKSLAEYPTYDIIPETIGQFTGLTDKNGTKIFEGDIVRLFDMVGKVCFEQGCFGIGTINCVEWEKLEEQILPITSCDNEPHFLYNDFFISFWELLWNYNECDKQVSTCEIIGNIHDNPELLGE